MVLPEGRAGLRSEFPCQAKREQSHYQLEPGHLPLRDHLTKLNPGPRNMRSERDYPAAAGSSPGDWPTETGAPRGCPRRPPLPSGFEASRRTPPD